MGIEDLYKYYEVLDKAKEKASNHEVEYQAILAAVKGSSQEKRLASQFIARFFKHFPKHTEEALNAVFDLCEDDDVAIRKQAIKDLPSLCKELPAILNRIAIVLTQLLQTDDTNEHNLVNMSLMSLLKQNTKDTLIGIFSQVVEADEIVRERALKFLLNKVKLLPEEALTKEIEDLIVTESKKVLFDVTGEEFLLFMKLLSGLKVMQTMMGRQQLLEIITEQADLDKPFDASDPDAVDRLMQCARQALPLLSKNVHSSKFITVMCDQVLPNLNLLSSGETNANGDASTIENANIQLDMLKLIAEMSLFAGDLKNPEIRLGHIFDRLLEFMPVAPATTEGDAKDEVKLQFSHVECLLFTFHQLCRLKPDFLTGDEARLKDFRARLQYFAHRTQLYVKDLKINLANRKPGDKSEENQIKVLALKTTNNITSLIKDLFHTPPSYKTSVTFSWKTSQEPASQPLKESSAPIAGVKRPSIEAPAGGQKNEVKRYAPPTGKFSDRTGGWRGRGGGGRGGGRGGFRRQNYW